ncbi:1-aminocyclopropane-1-carboxylate deaminase [Pseudoalteromonas rubra]|uniref:1-aminocyclopropane-1-carboxylate deaminase n=1 Tax=Pseudoalteromonas rubra TaxID=43658 RepID=A0A5S3WPA5_9GAMM|nr:pyridoxal-phosphate dependent enzyme [Pseudoalteromonas rubra]TMP30047.1 1-aminocyclopropane-1-carboxylate deaminase [Pseudoalteromonas rubra]TMP35684.1 1-aminocyclopropane-1-carboxylate deaminase [Pseudoalteromonas rubra]
MDKLDFPESPLQQIRAPELDTAGVSLQIKRDDLLHPTIQGNKWRKLKYNLKAMALENKRSLITFSGPFSNHLYATAMACKQFKIQGHAVIRGPELDLNNPTIRLARACGMVLHAVSRKEYRQRNEPDYLAQIAQQFPDAFVIPEGGSNQFALAGCKELAQSLPDSDYVCCAVGSGGTLAGMLDGLAPERQLLGVAVLKGAQYLHDEVLRLNPQAATRANWQLLCDHHDGGYGKFSAPLWQFCLRMRREHALPLEPIYTGKLMFALWQLIEQGYFSHGSRIIAIHSGGLQGLDGLRYRGLI